MRRENDKRPQQFPPGLSLFLADSVLCTWCAARNVLPGESFEAFMERAVAAAESRLVCLEIFCVCDGPPGRFPRLYMRSTNAPIRPASARRNPRPIIQTSRAPLTSDRTPTTGQWTAKSLPSLSGPSLSLTFQRPRPAAAASLAAIWIEHQADSVFKFLESTPVFQGNALSDDKAIHVAETAHDFASLDTAIMHAVRDVESGVHRIDLSNLVAP